MAPPRVPLSHAVRVDNLVFVSGTTPFDRDRQLALGDFAGQMEQVMANLRDILAEAGSSLAQVVKVNVILTRATDFEPMNEIYRRHFGDTGLPARTTIVAGLAIEGFLVEIECVAIV